MADPPLAQAAIGKGLGAVHNAIEYSIVVGDLSGYVINAGLMGAFRDRNPGLGGDSFPPLIALSHSCCNAKVMVDSMELKAKRDGDGTGTGGRDGSGFCYHSCMEANNRGDC